MEVQISVFQRAKWHSGLTYRQTCRTCQKVVEYTDHSLGFRPWYADGFVYCPDCHTPLRHSEELAIDRPASEETEKPGNEQPKSASAQQVTGGVQKAVAGNRFCTQCGKKYSENDRFCSGCGCKLG